MFESVFVANRGEIAVRVVRTLRRMGVRAVVAASIPDRGGFAARAADAVALLEGYSAGDTYLDVDAVIAAARAAGCDALHPGYGFLSERADFAEACAAGGIAFVGPPPAVLRALGDKTAARRLATHAGVPVVPGWDGDDDDATLAREAGRIGFPVMVKARGGGGGRGMREVRRAEHLPEALASARREAEAAFGDARLLLERLLEHAHHVEVQVVADLHGNVIHLGERECSVQRRHQKLIEETPSPVVDRALRKELTTAALKLARAAGYVSAGTFEFLVGEPGPGGRRPYYFLEVNPRLQVEHPVTEMVTGLDLVELQLRVAAGEPLTLAQDEVRFDGHAMEFRINAEDPREGFRPGAGRIRALEHPFARFDTGYEAGDVVPTQYDSLIAKGIVHARERVAALVKARTALAGLWVEGVTTNVALHRAVAAGDAFAAGAVSIDWLEPHLDALLATSVPPDGAWAAAAADLARARTRHTFAGARWLGAGSPSLWLSDGDSVRDVSLPHGRPRPPGFEVSPDSLQAVTVRAASGTGEWQFRVVPPSPLPHRARASEAGTTAISAPLSGTVAAVAVQPGDAVTEGQTILVLEAMKMEHRVIAPAAGRVKAVCVAPRDVVREGDVLAELE